MVRSRNEIQFTSKLSLAQAWEAIYPAFVRCFQGEAVEIRGKKVSPEKILSYLKLPGIDMVEVETFATKKERADSSLLLMEFPESRVRAMSHSEHRSRPLAWWDQWVQLLPSRFIICCCCFSVDYLMQQSCWNIARAKDYGIDIAKRPQVFNTDWNRKIFDVSKNPGLSISRKNHIESVGAVMWIGPRFTERTGGSWEPLRKYKWCKISEMNGLVRLQSFSRHFDSDRGEQARRQRILRETLFPNAGPVDSTGYDPSVNS